MNIKSMDLAEDIKRVGKPGGNDGVPCGLSKTPPKMFKNAQNTIIAEFFTLHR